MPRSARTTRRTAWTAWILVPVLALGLVWLIAGWAVLQHPRADAPARSDALLVLGPPDRTRMAEALRLMDAGLAPVLVVANPGSRDLGDASGRVYYARAAQTCSGDGEQDYEVICFRPDPSTTQGEAMELRALSEQRGWDHVSVLTYRQHVARSRLLLGRCYTGELDVLSFDYPDVPRGLLREFVYQSGGFVKAWLTPGCDQQLPWRPKTVD
ncbi:YdcF family protein [uncultured Kocuria sp.]|uniref:YdcF family protein n=1 Tax=uncultured Kocuria sp. TaxID=259305 RepID=UPI00262BDCCF|nr:YdcF family protein [uncultured Kocuria sp.]